MSRKKTANLLAATLVIFLVIFLSACAAPTARERLEERRAAANPRGAAYAAEGFTLDWRSPEPRPYQAWEFYFKHCSLEGRYPYPRKSEWTCTDPF